MSMDDPGPVGGNAPQRFAALCVPTLAHFARRAERRRLCTMPGRRAPARNRATRRRRMRFTAGAADHNLPAPATAVHVQCWGSTAMAISRRSFLQSGAGAALAAALPAPAVLAAEPIRIGVVQPFSGGLELFGNQAKLGLDLAAAEINAAGGILGSRIELVYEDDKTDPKTAVERTTSLVRRDKVIAVSGPITSNNRDAMMPTLSRAKVPLLYATNYEGGGCDRYLFSFNTVPNQELEKLLPAMKERAGSSFYMFGADYVWPQKMFEAAAVIIKGLGGSVAGTEFTPWGVKEFAPVIRRIKDSGAKVLVFALPGADGITFIRQAEELGLLKEVTVAFLGFAETYLGAFGEGKGQNMWVTVPFAASLDMPGVKDFVRKIRKSAGDA